MRIKSLAFLVLITSILIIIILSFIIIALLYDQVLTKSNRLDYWIINYFSVLVFFLFFPQYLMQFRLIERSKEGYLIAAEKYIPSMFFWVDVVWGGLYGSFLSLEMEHINGSDLGMLLIACIFPPVLLFLFVVLTLLRLTAVTW